MTERQRERGSEPSQTGHGRVMDTRDSEEQMTEMLEKGAIPTAKSDTPKPDELSSLLYNIRDALATALTGCMALPNSDKLAQVIVAMNQAAIALQEYEYDQAPQG